MPIPVFSSEYYAALEDSKKHHATSKTFSGKLMRPHAKFIRALIKQYKCRSLLDYGCGKGLQYVEPWCPGGKTLEEWWGIPVTKYDPAWPQFAREPEGQFDIVIVTHTLGCVPVKDLPAVVDRLVELAGNGQGVIYIAERIGPPKAKMVKTVASALPESWRVPQWLHMVYRDKGVIYFAARTEDGRTAEAQIKHYESRIADGHPSWAHIQFPEGLGEGL